MMKKIIIDAGHGGKDSGALGNGLQEKNLTLIISKHVKEYLEANYTDIQVKLTRTTDVFIELSDRANIANKFGADTFMSCHVNAGGGTGFESFVYSKPSQASIALQNIVNAEAIAVAKKYGLGTHGNDKKRDNLAVVRETHMPAILTEICFIDSKDANLLKKDEFLRDMAAAYARGIAKFLGLKGKVETTSTVNKSEKIYKVQVGAFTDKKNADALAEKLKKQGHKPVIV